MVSCQCGSDHLRDVIRSRRHPNNECRSWPTVCIVKNSDLGSGPVREVCEPCAVYLVSTMKFQRVETRVTDRSENINYHAVCTNKTCGWTSHAHDTKREAEQDGDGHTTAMARITSRDDHHDTEVKKGPRRESKSS